MAADGLSGTNATHATLDLLAVRLRRLEFLLSGSSDLDGLPDGIEKPSKPDETVMGRLRSLQSSLEKLRKDSGVAGEMVRDIEALHSQFPELQKLSTPAPSAVQDLAAQAQIVLANATLFPETASRLSSLKTLQIPPAESSVKLNELSPEIQAAQAQQEKLDAEVSELRARSARVLEWWVKVGVLGMGDLWEEWEQRLEECDREVRREQRRRADEEGYL